MIINFFFVVFIISLAVIAKYFKKYIKRFFTSIKTNERKLVTKTTALEKLIEVTNLRLF